MAKKQQQFVEDIAKMDEDFSQWYTDVIRKTDMVDYSPVKGFMVIKPYGYALWEGIQSHLDRRFKETGHKNCYFPLLIPESLLKKEAEHVEGFAPEVAWVTHGGDNELGERLCVRPTSETIICEMYSKWLSSWRDLPYLYNQWCSVVRWEQSTRPFLRTSEFLWQEGHTLHETKEEANAETLQMLDIYREMCEELLAIPVVTGQKSENEKFAGGEATYTIEALMHDGKALQSGTSHFLGQHFTKAFNITFTDRNGREANPYHTSWGVSTRLIGAIIMVHGDDRGLVLPPRVAPTQVVMVPIAAHKGNVMEVVDSIYEDLKPSVRVEVDDRKQSPGWKFNEWEMKGVPLRIEIGPKDIENKQVTIFRRDTLEKTQHPMDNLKETVENLLEEVHANMLKKATEMREAKTYKAETMDELKQIMENTPGFVKIMWSGELEEELEIKEATGATIRCMPFEQEKIFEKSITGKEAKHLAYVARAY